jgi:hypothetical protein
MRASSCRRPVRRPASSRSSLIKAGRCSESATAAASHTGAMAGSDAVYEAAFSRAGILRVNDLEALFDAVATLGMLQPVTGDRLAILTNGGGIGVMATDTLIYKKGQLGPACRRHHGSIECGLATYLVSRQSGGYHRRCLAPALYRRVAMRLWKIRVWMPCW